ncbi:MAG: hypothetical protein LC800_06980, partial [Acidobacteria bacterium]|nr:hypothetical protein [Acidobacteriota bacterium]
VLGNALFSAGVTWAVYSDLSPPQPMMEGEDYLVLSGGGLTGQAITLVFKPPMPGGSPPDATTAYVRATAVVTVMDLVGIPPQPEITTGSRDFDIEYSVAVVEDDVLDGLIRQLCDQLYVGVPQLIVHPGDLVTARVLPRKAPPLPQLVTSLLDEVPSVEIRGSVPLDNILNYILEPFRAVTSLIPSSNPLSKADEVAANVKKILPSALTLPLRLDVKGRRLTTAFAPIGDKLPISFSRTPDESGDIRGFLPLGQWPLPFSIPNTPVINPPDAPAQAGIEWLVSYDGETDDNGQTNNFLTGTLNNLVFPPTAHALGLLPPPAANQAVITVRPFLSIYDEVLTLADPDPLPGIALQVLPLYVPEVVITSDPISNPTALGVHVSCETGTFAGSLEELWQLLGTLGAVLNGLIATLGTTPAGFEYADLIYLGRTIKAMSDVLTRADLKISFVIADSSNLVSVCAPAKVSSFFAIAPRPIVLSQKAITTPPAVGVEYLVTLTDPPADNFLSTYVGSLNDKFSLVRVTPPTSIRASNPEYVYNNFIQYIQFGARLPGPDPS